MEKQQRAPVLNQFFMGENHQVNPIWQRWFERLAERNDQIRRPPYKTYSADATLTTWEMGKAVLFETGTSNLVCTLFTPGSKDLWCWVTIFRTGTGRLTVTADSASRIEYSSIGGSIICQEPNRKAANVTLQLIEANQWAIVAGLGIWDLD